MQSVEERQAVPASGRYRDAKAHEKLMEDNLRMKGFEYGGKEEHVFVLLLHLFTAVSMYDELTAYDRKIVDVYQKKFKNIFDSKFSVKQRKRNLKEKKVSPTPLSIDKESPKEKGEKTKPKEGREALGGLEERREAFRQECLKLAGQYDEKHLEDFFNFYSETSRKTGKMRFEAYQYFNIKNRIIRWVNNHIAADNENAAIRLKTTKKQANVDVNTKEQKAVAAQREADNQKREQEHEENKKKAVSLEEYLKQHPEASNLKIFKKK